MLLVSVVVPFSVFERTAVEEDVREIMGDAVIVLDPVFVFDDVIERLVEGDDDDERVL